MSDFDKEAERERLREKYEQEQADREATEKMSELLLQGATMTNAHCSDCGDPIFRYDGQEFCATCEKAVDRGENGADAGSEGDGAGDDSTDEAGADDQDRIEVTTPSEGARVRFGTDADDGQPADRSEGEGRSGDDGDAEAGPREQVDPTRAERDRTESTRPDRGHADRERVDRPRTTVPSVEPGSRGTGSGSGAGAGANLATARESLVRTLAQLTRKAETADDPVRAREYLEAAREAAETMAALRR